MKRRTLLSVCLLAALVTSVAIWLRGGTEPAPPEQPANVPTSRTGAIEPVAATPPAVAEPARVPANSARTTAVAEGAHADAAQGVSGRVIDERGRPLAEVEALLLESPTNDPVHRLLSLAQNVPVLATAAMRTDAKGEFRLGLRAVDERQYEICLDRPGCATARVGDVHIHTGEWLDLGDLVLAQGATIHGRVTVDGTDLPAPGAVVRLESGDPFFDVGPAQLSDWRERHTAAVDANGYYELRDAPRSGTFRLMATAPGFGRHIRDQVQIVAGQPVELDFALPRGRSIGGRLDTGGGTLTAVHVEAFAKAAEPQFPGIVTADGRFFVHGLRDGPHLLRIAADGYQPVAIDNVAAGTEDLVVNLTPRGRASVEVLDGDGAMLRKYRLAVRRYFPETGQIAAVRDVPDRVVQLEPGERAVTVEGLDPGTFVFQVEADGWASTLSPEFHLDTEHPRATVTMSLVRGGGLLGLVVDGTGRPIAGATVTTQPNGAADDNPVLRVLAGLTPDRIRRLSATTDANGNFRMSQLAYGDYQLQIDHANYCRCVRTAIEIGSNATVNLAPVVLLQGTMVRGHAFVDGVAAAQVRIVLTPDLAVGVEPGPLQKSRDETTVGRVEAVTNIDGSYELPRRVPPGRYELRGVLQLGSDPGADPFQKLLQMKKSATRLSVSSGQELAEVDLRLASDH